jgi:glutathione S-transferase
MNQDNSLHLVSHHLCPYVQRAVIVLTEKGIDHKRTYIDLSNKPEWFRNLSPLGRTPVLEVGNAVVFESQVIVEYLDEITPKSLHSSDPLIKARDRSWIEFGSETLNAIGGFYNVKGATNFVVKTEALREKLHRIDREIEGPWFGGESFRMIDGVWGTIFRYLDVFDKIADFRLMEGLANVQRWRATIAKRPSVVNAVASDYPDRLLGFLLGRASHLSGLITEQASEFAA